PRPIELVRLGVIRAPLPPLAAPRPPKPRVFQYGVQRRAGEVQPRHVRMAYRELSHDAVRLRVALEPVPDLAEIDDEPRERPRGDPRVGYPPERLGLARLLAEHRLRQPPLFLRDLETVRQTVVEYVSLFRAHILRPPREPPEGRRVKDAVPVPLFGRALV